MPASPLVKVEYTGTPRFILAATGEQILLRGGNVIMTASDSVKASPVSAGANMVRVVLNWNRLEPNAPAGAAGTDWSQTAPHTLAASELALIDAVCQEYADAGMYVQLDFHQASWSPYFGGSGIPSWYYQDARFAGGLYASGANSPDKSNAINNWWTSVAETAKNQALYIGFVKTFMAWAQAQAWYPNVVGYQVFNEPNPGAGGGSSATKVGKMHAWLAPVVDVIHAQDPERCTFLMCRGGGQGYGTATFSAFDIVGQRIVLEWHGYYTGQEPGYPALANPDVGYDSAGDDYFPNSAACHNTTSGSVYTGHQDALDAYLGVAIAKAASLGCPLFVGECGVHFDDPGRLDYIAQWSAVIDAHQLSCTVWKFGSTPSDNLGLNNGDGSLNDMGQAWSDWWQATSFIVGGTTAQAPSNTSPPTVSPSTPVVGQAISADAGTWTGSPAPTFTYTWQAFDGAAWNPAAGSLGSDLDAATYTVQAGDEGLPLRVKVVGSNASGSVTAHSDQTSAVAAAPVDVPVNTTPPTVTPSTKALSGQTITADPGAWTNTPTGYTYQWVRKDPVSGAQTDIAGATSSTYTPGSADEADQLAVRVVAANAGGSSAAAMSAFTDPPGPPVALLNPALTDQTPLVGERIAVGQGVWSGAPTSFTYQWQTDGDGTKTTWTDIAGETGNEYVVQAGDAGKNLRCRVTASNAQGSTTYSGSNAQTSSIAAGTGQPVATTTPGLDDLTPFEGQTLTATPPATDPASTSVTYQWFRQDTLGGPAADTTSIAGATAATYTTTSTDVGCRVWCKLTLTNGVGSHSIATIRGQLVQAGTAPTFTVTFDDPLNGAVVTTVTQDVLVEVDGSPSSVRARADGGAWITLAPAGTNGSATLWQGTVTLVGGDGDHTIDVQPII